LQDATVQLLDSFNLAAARVRTALKGWVERSAVVLTNSRESGTFAAQISLNRVE